MADLTDPAFWIPTIISILAVIPLYLDWLNRRKATQAIDFELEKFNEIVKLPIASVTSIRVLHPSKPVDHCKVFFGNGFLSVANITPIIRECKIPNMGGANFRIPDPLGLDIEDTIVKVMDGNRTLRKTTLREIPEVPA